MFEHHVINFNVLNVQSSNFKISSSHLSCSMFKFSNVKIWNLNFSCSISTFSFHMSETFREIKLVDKSSTLLNQYFCKTKLFEKSRSCGTYKNKQGFRQNACFRDWVFCLLPGRHAAFIPAFRWPKSNQVAGFSFFTLLYVLNFFCGDCCKLTAYPLGKK